MTELQVRQKVINTAYKYLGCNEADGSHRKIVDRYNSHTPRPRGYKVKYTDAWCATYVSAVGIELGYEDIILPECSCGVMIELYRKKGRWMETDSYRPQIADIVMYDWDDNGSGDCTGYPEHVGFVYSISGNTMKVIEGNYSNAVKIRTLQVNGRYIRGYCLPDYAKKANGVSQPVTPPTSNNGGGSSSSADAPSKKKQYDGVVTADELNVRIWAGTENSTCSFSPLKEGTKVEVCDSVKANDGSIWYYIKYNGKYGFAHSKYISKVVVESTLPASNNDNGKIEYAQSFSNSIAGTYKVTANDGLMLRAGAGTSKRKLTAMPKGSIVNCYGYYTTSGGVKWYFVTYETYTGFCSSQYLARA